MLINFILTPRKMCIWRPKFIRTYTSKVNNEHKVEADLEVRQTTA